ncbi:MAG: O-antigen ligase family protein [Solirubrobacterales bacterium]
MADDRRRLSAGLDRAEEQAAVLLLGCLTALFVWWGWKEGAYFGPVFYPGAIALFLLGALLLARVPLSEPLSGPARVALAAIFALGAWTLLSILWTPVRASAVADAARVFAYGTVFATGLWVTRMLAGRRVLVLAPLAAAGAVVGVATLATVWGGTDLLTLLHEDATLRFPIGYRNANAAFFLVCLWPLAGIAAHPPAAWWLRAVAVGAATMLLEVAFLAQSRGSAPAAALALLAFVLLAPQRLRAAIVVALIVIPAAFALPTLLDVYQHGHVRGVGPLLDDAAAAAAITSAASLLLAAGVFGAVAPRLRVGDPARRAISLGLAAVAILAVLAGGAVFVARHGGPIGFVDQRVSEFRKSEYPDLRGQGVRFGANIGSNRGDFWRVGLAEGADHPLLGGGAGAFQLAYLQERESPETPKDPHSIPVRIFAELGLPGLVAWLAFLGAALLAAWRSRRRGPVEALVVAAATAGALQWALQGSYDWFWQYPGVTAPGFFLFGVAAAPAAGGGELAPWLRRGGAAALCLLALLAVPLFLSDRYAQRGLQQAGADPEAALADLGRAADLNPFDSLSLLNSGAIESRLGHRRAALADFEEASSREPDDYAAHWLIARELLRTDPARARAELAEARSLNPLGPEIAALQRALRRESPGRGS